MSLSDSKEQLAEVADGYVSASESKVLIAGAEQEIAEDHELLDGKYTVEQIDEHVNTVKAHAEKTETAVTLSLFINSRPIIRIPAAKIQNYPLTRKTLFQINRQPIKKAPFPKNKNALPVVMHITVMATRRRAQRGE